MQVGGGRALPREFSLALAFAIGLLTGLLARDHLWTSSHGNHAQWEVPASRLPELAAGRLPELAAGNARQEELCRVARQAAIDDQVLLLIGDKNVFAPPNKNDTLIAKMMHSLMELQVNNVLMVAVDSKAYEHGRLWAEYAAKRIALHVLHRDVPTPGVLMGRLFHQQQSAKKFEVLGDLMLCGVHALLSDFDIVLWHNPFEHLVGDADVEAMTDGYDYDSTYGIGFDTCLKPPCAGARWPTSWEWRIVVLNSGFFYIRASRQTAEAMAATWRLLTREPIWDQAAFNLAIWAPLGTPAGGRLSGQGLRIRVMNPHKFSNSRVMNELVEPLPKGASNFVAPRLTFAPNFTWSTSAFFNPNLTLAAPNFTWPTSEGRPVAAHMNYHRHKVAMMAWASKIFGEPGDAH